MEINFYKYAGKPKTVNKQLGNPTVLSGVLWDDFNFITPILVIRKNDVSMYNYCFIPNFNRYYFIDECSLTNKNEFALKLSLDVLKTYETQILQSNGVITERDNSNRFISNRGIVYNRKPNFEKVSFPNTGLLNPDGSIIMITIKGKDN